MTIYAKIRDDLKQSMLNKDKILTSAIRVIIGEFQRNDLKDPTDDDAIKILKKLQKSEKTLLVVKNEETSDFLEIIESYLPKMMTKEEIAFQIGQSDAYAKFISSRIQNKIQAMGPIMKEFKSKGLMADGNLVKEVLQEI